MEDETELTATITNINMHPKSIDFDMQDTAFDCDIDIEFYNNVTYRDKEALFDHYKLLCASIN